MISPEIFTDWRSNAGFCRVQGAGLDRVGRLGWSDVEARPSSMFRALVCQNHYPSPSKWSGPEYWVRPHFVGDAARLIAEMARKQARLVAKFRVARMDGRRGGATIPAEGEKTCEHHSVSWLLRRRLPSRHAATQILNGDYQARPSVPLARSSRAAIFSPARPLAAQRVRCVTTSRPKSASRYTNTLSNHRLPGRDAPAAYFVRATRCEVEETPCSKRS